MADRTGANRDEISLISVESVQWPDARLGCPEPGLSYAQVVSPEYRIILSVEDQEFAFHSDVGSVIMICSGAEAGVGIQGDSDPTVKDGGPNQPLGDDIIIVPPKEGSK